MEFSHPYFQRDHPYLLEHIKRKISTAKTANVDDKANVKHEIVSKVLNDVKMMKGRQDSLDNRFLSIKQENEALWREVAILRQKHLKQQQIVNKLIQFLVTIVQPQRGSGIGSMGGMGGVKRRYQLMINDIPDVAKHRKTARSATPASKGPVIRELTEDLLEGYVDGDDGDADAGGGGGGCDGGIEDVQVTSPYVVSPGSFPPSSINDYEEIEQSDDIDPDQMITEDGETIAVTAPIIDDDDAATIYNTADYNSDLIYDLNTNKAPAIGLARTDAGTSHRTINNASILPLTQTLGELTNELLGNTKPTLHAATASDQIANFIKPEPKQKQPVVLHAQTVLKPVAQRPRLVANAKQIPGNSHLFKVHFLCNSIESIFMFHFFPFFALFKFIHHF